MMIRRRPRSKLNYVWKAFNLSDFWSLNYFSCRVLIRPNGKHVDNWSSLGHHWAQSSVSTSALSVLSTSIAYYACRLVLTTSTGSGLTFTIAAKENPSPLLSSLSAAWLVSHSQTQSSSWLLFLGGATQSSFCLRRGQACGNLNCSTGSFSFAI